MMRWSGLGLVLFTGWIPSAAGQDVAPKPPIVELALPPEIAPETAQINYFMIGPFGGYGGFIATNKDRSTYTIVAAVNGKPASEVKVVAYVPGCEIETFDFEMQATMRAQFLVCNRAGSTMLHGKIPRELIAGKATAKIEVSYQAMWTRRFFGIMDGPSVAIQIGKVAPNEEGEFEIEVPDSFSLHDRGEGYFQFMLRESKSGNIRAFLAPADESTNSPGLSVRASYPPMVRFTGDLLREWPMADE